MICQSAFEALARADGFLNQYGFFVQTLEEFCKDVLTHHNLFETSNPHSSTDEQFIAALPKLPRGRP